MEAATFYETLVRIYKDTCAITYP